ncbi:beta-propeller fold lactonase family protein [uncultured Sphaerochaeta sp.]|uniref:lactonase family protein n=1 Tax=uncultured Sphaerochaeta sp. TaxID=886478 RepID=UPI002A0A6ECB|nr:beta-propeller fold lactonase family protein [uncultured Sphaerochaeta sp.]
MHQEIMAIGGYGETDKENVFVYQAEDKDCWKLLDSIQAGKNPSYLCFGTQDILYVVNERNQPMHQTSGLVKTFSLPKPGLPMQELGSISSFGDDPCFLTLDPQKKFLLATNYSSGTVVIYSLTESGIPDRVVQLLQFSGSGPHPTRQLVSHPHSILFDKEGTSLYVADLGTDQLHHIAWNPEEILPCTPMENIAMPSGSGPRLIRFSPDGKSLYVVNELANTVSFLEKESEAISHTFSTLENPVSGATAAHMELYKEAIIVSNRKANTLWVHTSIQDTWHACSGDGPRFFALEKNRLFLAYQNSDLITTCNLQEDFSLSKEKELLKVPKPTCIQFSSH